MLKVGIEFHCHVFQLQMQVLLATWKEKMPVDQALELLDFNFPDNKVRKYGVNCLQELRYALFSIKYCHFPKIWKSKQCRPRSDCS